jgi:hypothetical protein
VATPEHKKAPPERGFLNKRLKGLEPSTFCMAKAKIDVESRWNKEIAYIYKG